MSDVSLAATSSVPDGAICSICLCAVEDVSRLQCLSCVCEGVFHETCLERLQKMDSGLRRCPHCRREGRRISVKTVLDAYLGAGDEDLLRLKKHLRARLKALRTQETVKSLSRKSFRVLPWTAPEGIRCCLCSGLVETFRDVSLLGCSCCALVHASCMPVAETGELMYCERCQEPLPEPSAICLKQLTREYVTSGQSFVERHRLSAASRVSASLRAVRKRLRRTTRK
jgi:hypothetical protein